MRDQETRRRDRSLALAVLCSVLLGAVCIVFAIWGTLHPWRDVSPRGVGPGAGFVVGPIFIGFGILEAVHRVRNGPQQPGSHARSAPRE